MNRLLCLLSALLLCSVLAACATQGKPGTPLPPQNKAVGQKWAPEVRAFIDALLTEFQDGKPAPTVGRIEKVFGVKAVGEKGEFSRNEKQYVLRGWALGNPSMQGSSAFYMTYVPRNGTMRQIATFNIDANRYCINPYDFAIYTGASFSVAPTAGFHDPVSPLNANDQFAYLWGVFDRSPSGQYMFGKTGVGRGMVRLTNDKRCIESFEMYAKSL